MDPQGVHVGSARVEGTALRLRAVPGGLTLLSRSAVEPLNLLLEVAVGSERTLALEPGVRAERTGRGIRLSTHGNRRIVILAPDGPRLAESPLDLDPDAPGWGIGVASLRLQASPQPQDDAEKHLDAMRQSAERLRAAMAQRPPQQRLVFGSLDPSVMADTANSHTIRQLLQVTPTGSP
jgi:hypothetical protein